MSMATNRDETGAGGESAGWLGQVYARLKAKMDEAVDALCKADKVETVGDAEKLARAAGVIARAAKAVAALETRFGANSEEDEMGGRTYDPEEDERLRRELDAREAELDVLIERKRIAQTGRGGATAGASPEGAAVSPDPAAG